MIKSPEEVARTDARIFGVRFVDDDDRRGTRQQTLYRVPGISPPVGLLGEQR